MNVDPTIIAALATVPPEVLKKLYDDVISPAAVEVGQFNLDAAKAFRLFTSPVHLFATWKDRLFKALDEVRSRVPAERQVEAPASIAGPVIENLKYVEEDSPLKEMYLNLLTRAIDKERQSEAHPAFIKVIEQLSRDEAAIISRLKQGYIGQLTSMLYPANIKSKTSKNSDDFKDDMNRLLQIVPEGSKLIAKSKYSNSLQFPDSPYSRTPPVSNLAFPNRWAFYLTHLISLQVINYEYEKMSYERESEDGAKRARYKVIVELSEFGVLFAQCCVPDLPEAESSDSKGIGQKAPPARRSNERGNRRKKIKPGFLI